MNRKKGEQNFVIRLLSIALATNVTVLLDGNMQILTEELVERSTGSYTVWRCEGHVKHSHTNRPFGFVSVSTNPVAGDRICLRVFGELGQQYSAIERICKGSISTRLATGEIHFSLVEYLQNYTTNTAGVRYKCPSKAQRGCLRWF